MFRIHITNDEGIDAYLGSIVEGTKQALNLVGTNDWSREEILNILKQCDAKLWSYG